MSCRGWATVRKRLYNFPTALLRETKLSAPYLAPNMHPTMHLLEHGLFRPTLGFNFPNPLDPSSNYVTMEQEKIPCIVCNLNVIKQNYAHLVQLLLVIFLKIVILGRGLTFKYE